MGLEVEVEAISIKPLNQNVFCEERRRISYTSVIPLSTTVPGFVFPFLSACATSVG